MDLTLKNATVYLNGEFVNCDLFISEGKVFSSKPTSFSNTETIDCLNKYIFPGFIDVHTHLREPGFSYKETVKSGTLAGASAGYSALFTMPNLSPVPDCVENLKVQQDIIDKDAVISVYPFCSITKGEKGEELSALNELSNFVLGFSDDGKGVQSEEMMLSAMKIAKENDKVIVAHCEDESLLFGGYIHDGQYAKLNGHKGISSESEYKPIARDIELVKKTGVKYHVCHVSAKESVELIRKAKKDGLDVSGETAPHYLVLHDMMISNDGCFKMNPPIREKDDMEALIEGIKDGTIEIIATDHAPHSLEEKSKGLLSLNGIVGLETAFPILYTYLVKNGIISLEKLIELMSINPAKRFNLPVGIVDGNVANLAVFDLDEEYEIDPKKFYSKGKSTPFKGYRVQGKCVLNIHNGKIVYKA